MESVQLLMRAGMITGAAMLASAGSVQAGTYEFIGNCEDCAAAAGTATFEVTGVLELAGGQVQDGTVDADDFVSWQYNGSNLLDRYLVVPSPTFTGAPPWQHGIFLGSGSSAVSGTIVGGAIKTLDLRFGDGLEFLLAENGDWSSCGVNSDGYYGVPCSWQTAQDYGKVTSFSAPIPEPSTYGLMALGLLGLVARHRCKKS